MPMFDWNASPSEAVSGHFWVYWAVTLPLTLAVIGVWLLWINPKKLSLPEHRSLSRRKAKTTDLDEGGERVTC